MHDAWFFIGIFVFIFLIWIAVGGPTHPISFTGPSLPLPAELGGGTYLQLPRAPFAIGGGSTVVLPGSSNGTSVQNTSGQLPLFVGGSTFGDPSPYLGIASMSHYISGAGSAFPTDESVDLSATQNSGIPVYLSGWKLVSDITGNVATLPQGTEIPLSGAVNILRDIVLAPGVQATVISGRSPIGTSFRENKCIGYLSTFQRFSPPLPQYCPMPSDDLASFYGAGYFRDDACVDYVDTLKRCETIITPIKTVSAACQNFVTKYINYNGCVDAHKNDKDFLGNTWRIYLGRYSSMWRTKNEIVKLLDTRGKTVDAFSY